MMVVIGLGNPGPEYAWTRHNAGFLVLDRLAARHGLAFRKQPLFESSRFGRNLLVRPLTYMNRSGEALKSVRSKNPVDGLLVVSDDLYLPLGTLRIRERGGDGGHNGLKSIIESWGDGEFPRLRIGVGEPEGDRDSADYVLARFRPEERPVITEALDRAADLLEAYCAGGYAALQNAISRK